VPSAYWSLGGTAGLDTVGGAIEQLGRTRDPAGIALGLGAGVLKVAGGLLVVVGALVLGGLISPSGPVDRTALRWHVFLWDLWFLVWGLLFGVAAWQSGRGSRRRGTR
jgi:hypothetical protein